MIKRNKLLFIDTETGGVNPDKFSLLSIGFAVWENGQIVSKKHFLLKQECYSVNPQALSINNINLIELYKKGIEAKKLKKEILNFFKINFQNTEKIVLGGHNVKFDISFLRRLFKKIDLDFDEYFSHRCVDTSSILRFLYHSGVLSKDISSSSKAFKYFKINVSNRHSALGDAIATANLYTKLIKKINISRK